MNGVIEIRRLKVLCHIGVPDEERAAPQEVLVTLKMTPEKTFGQMEDEIADTIDYAAVAVAVQALALAKPRKLIETLADDIYRFVATEYAVNRVEVSIEKFILPDTECVSVQLSGPGLD